MTGYGRASAPLGAGTLSVQVGSVNRRSLDLSVRLPQGWDGLEADVVSAVRAVAARGKVQVTVEYSPTKGSEEAAWNTEGIGAALDRLADLADSRRIPFEPTAQLLWQIAMSQKAGAEAPSADAAAKVLAAALGEALRGFAKMRAAEGDALLADLTARLDACRRHIDAVGARSAEVAPAYRAQLMKRLRDAGLELNVEDERVLREVALFADRSDISEEITRFRSHIDQLAGLLGAGEEVGRKADFILQEMGREANTIGSKANDLAISKAVIELKNELERIREQTANVE
ncbi:MAG TPA: YicC/YloC family endoribonuclease [Opitutaceae bacterium]